MSSYREYCAGCAVPEGEKINLPAGWKDGDPIPENVTVHYSTVTRSHFMFRGDPKYQDRVLCNGGG